MILSFHPNIVASKNILCAGRSPNDEDRRAVQEAKAIILPQGCSKDLYRLCRKHCDHVFPNYDARFDFPGKLGQARLFKKTGAPFPLTHTFETLSFYYSRYGQDFLTYPIDFPCVFKSDWGGEGEGVFLLNTAEDLGQALKKAEAAEKGGLKGFLLQEYIPSRGRSLRVVVIGDKFLSYWRVQKDPSEFLASMKAGAVIDHEADPELQEAGRAAVRGFCSKTGINLAGFDLLFSQHDKAGNPFFLEINYFFGRRGLGGSFKYYELVEKSVRDWLGKLGLSL
ncbi:MAG: glutathione synthase [Desulfobacterales bacterium]|nr:glutathione synthase [Desulfobacterales bacterium]